MRDRRCESAPSVPPGSDDWPDCEVQACTVSGSLTRRVAGQQIANKIRMCQTALAMFPKAVKEAVSCISCVCKQF